MARAQSAQSSLLLRHPAYKKRDVVDLFIEAKAYIQGRIPVPDKETAIAILLSRGRGAELPNTKRVADYGLGARKWLG